MGAARESKVNPLLAVQTSELPWKQGAQMSVGSRSIWGSRVKDATVKVFHDETLESLSAHVFAFVAAYNFTKHLKALR